MASPAVRLGDPTAHGGVVNGGEPTVLVGGRPMARIGDFHACPMCDGLKPHVGGPILTGSPIVFVGGVPAARVGDTAACAGPIDSLTQGDPTVLIA